MSVHRSHIEPRPTPEVTPQPEPPQPQPVDPIPEVPKEFPRPEQPVEEPLPPREPEIAPDPENAPTRAVAIADDVSGDVAVPHLRPEPVPSMPVRLPTGDAENPRTSPLRHDQDTEMPDPTLPPGPGHDINP
jgi:hypothetical protein